MQLTEQDMKFIGKQIGNLLLTAEVFKDLEWDQTCSDISFKVRNLSEKKMFENKSKNSST